MAVTFSWLRLAAKAAVVLVAAKAEAAEVPVAALAAALVLAELAVAQAEACSPDMEAKAAQVKEPKAVC